METKAGVRVDPRIERSTRAVIDAAVALLLEGGTRAVTVDAIVARSGVAKTTIYRHWESRADVVLAAFGQLLPTIPDAPVDVALGEGLRTVLGRLAHALTENLWAAAIPALLDGASRDAELAGLRERLSTTQRAPLAAVLQRAVVCGELPVDTDVAEAISYLGGPLIYRRLISNEPIDEGFVDRLVTRFLAGRGLAMEETPR